MELVDPTESEYGSVIMVLRRINESDLDFAAECTANEGWASETRDEFGGFFEHDPEGCFIAEENGRRIGMGVATNYGEHGFIGELIVIKEKRGQGIGGKLLDHAVRYLREKRTHHIYLDGVVAAVSLYERAGFCKICRSLRFTGCLSGKRHSSVRNMTRQDVEAIYRMDRIAFGADRHFFLKRRFLLYPKLCKVMERNGQIIGYIMGRRGVGLVSFGPWLVLPDVESSEALLESAAVEVNGSRMGIGVLETNRQAVEMIRSLGLAEKPDPPWRMVLGSPARLGLSNRLFAIGSAATG